MNLQTPVAVDKAKSVGGLMQDADQPRVDEIVAQALIKSRMGAALKYYTVEKGLTGKAPDAPAAFVGMCHLLCDSVEAYRSSLDPHGEEISRDIRNYTDLTPVIQISEVVVENSAKG
jgi:uncharacterized protein (TIGR02118 family)